MQKSNSGSKHPLTLCNDEADGEEQVGRRQERQGHQGQAHHDHGVVPALPASREVRPMGPEAAPGQVVVPFSSDPGRRRVHGRPDEAGRNQGHEEDGHQVAVVQERGHEGHRAHGPVAAQVEGGQQEPEVEAGQVAVGELAGGRVRCGRRVVEPGEDGQLGTHHSQPDQHQDQGPANQDTGALAQVAQSCRGSPGRPRCRSWLRGHVVASGRGPEVPQREVLPDKDFVDGADGQHRDALLL